MRAARIGLAVTALLLASPASAAPEIDLPSIALQDTPFFVGLRGNGPYEVSVDGQVVDRGVLSGQSKVPLRISTTGETRVVVSLAGSRTSALLRVLPAWTSLIPAASAILLAIFFRHVLLALVFGVWCGAFLVHGYSPINASARLLDTNLVLAIADRDHASVLLFSLLLGGMLGLIARSGGAHGLARWATTKASNRRRGQLWTWFLGLLIFFDDYANSLLVGASMRPVTDRLRISREKLAYLVDATAAPVASLALVSSWVAVEVGYIGDQFRYLGIEKDPYLTFVETIPYRFYPILMLMLVAWVGFRDRDFGPMLTAERRAVHDGLVSRPGAQLTSDFEAEHPSTPGRPGLAIGPVLVFVLVATGGIYFDGRARLIDASEPLSFRTIVGSASSTAAILWASGAGCLTAMVASVSVRALSLRQSIDALIAGMRGMLLACAILVLAWALGDVCRELHTGEYLIRAVGDWIEPIWIPATAFVLAALTSFATGTAWGTMAILFPLVVPLAHQLAIGDEPILLGAISSILAGAVWGDHCSPISDTTILSSMAASCDHVDHVRTQLPYALLVGAVSLLCGELPVAAGWYGPWTGLAIGAAGTAAAFELLSKRVGAQLSGTVKRSPD